MRSFLSEFGKTRLGKYLLYSLIYIAMLNIVGFELTIVTMGCLIIAESDYRYENRDKNN